MHQAEPATDFPNLDNIHKRQRQSARHNPPESSAKARQVMLLVFASESQLFCRLENATDLENLPRLKECKRSAVTMSHALLCDCIPTWIATACHTLSAISRCYVRWRHSGSGCVGFAVGTRTLMHIRQAPLFSNPSPRPLTSSIMRSAVRCIRVLDAFLGNLPMHRRSRCKSAAVVHEDDQARGVDTSLYLLVTARNRWYTDRGGG
ncbi:hypothetical protein OBBRIDRAFT_84506 [Obba rivulosa]|uniref:Uncharacterized protein n=1 Tax=Obba rivulosa TaxID=1052685 RepID=A0A8E2ASL3_9APHY|nr:hypothetical protein OBBRIDRAFT_84506 [Obba rivulosa]